MSEPVLREHESGHDMVRIFYWLPWQKCKERIGDILEYIIIPVYIILEARV